MSFSGDENGDFMECYGSACMAYFEYETVSAPFARPSDLMSSVAVEKQTIKFCKQMAIYAPAPNYCG